MRKHFFFLNQYAFGKDHTRQLVSQRNQEFLCETKEKETKNKWYGEKKSYNNLFISTVEEKVHNPKENLQNFKQKGHTFH